MMKNKTKMTPRTDAAWAAAFRENPFSGGKAARALREFSEKLERELAAERARLDWLEDHGWITGEPCDRAAIDAAMKEETK